jgi:hypothetical protein
MESLNVTNLFEPNTNKDLRCCHAITGDAPASKQCANWFNCASCEYDQMLEDTVQTAKEPVQVHVGISRAA